MQKRRKTRQVTVGDVRIGGDAPISVQSMTTMPAGQIEETLEQIAELAEAGCDLVRVAAATVKDTRALRTIVAQSPLPIIADVHFHYRRGLEAIEAGCHKLRINPGNLTDRKQLESLIAAARSADVPIRIGLNAGSVRGVGAKQRARSRKAKPNLLTALTDKLARYVRFFEKRGFESLVLSAKAHDVPTTIAAYRAVSERFDYPLHLGLTHAGPPKAGTLKSAIALGALLAEGIGDTIRVSLTGDPVEEVRLGRNILAELHLGPRQEPEIISCPTCGRCQIDLARLVEQVEQRLSSLRSDLKIAVMGCMVNGPGEAEDADVGLAAGKGKAMLFRHGKKIRLVPEKDMLDALMEEVKRAGDYKNER